MGTRINNKGVVTSFDEIAKILEWSAEIQQEVVTNVINCNHNQHTKWTFEFSVNGMNYSANIDLTNLPESNEEITSVIAVAKLSNS
jgi:hypothetical protein